MLSEREVINTLNMLRNEHLDVRTVTLGVSLFDCVSHDIDLFTGNVKAKLHRYASQLVNVCNEVGDKYGIPVVNKRISVSPIAVVGAPFGPDGMVRVCQALDEAAKEAGVDFLGGFSALVEKGFANGDRALIEALPEALATTDRICSSINVASSRSGINMDAVALMGEQILKVAQATADRGGLGCAKLVVFANIPQDVPFMAGAYLGVGEPDVVINVGVSGPGVVKKAIDRALGSKAGIGRYGFALPMDDCRALVLLDFGGRIDFEWDAEFRRERVGDVPTEMFRHFFHSLCCAARCNLQISARGGNDHHKAEAIFKAFARALRMAVARTGFGYDIPSSKGIL